MEENAHISSEDIERLRKYYDLNPTARSLFDYLRSRRRGTPSTSVDKLLARMTALGQQNISRADVSTFLRTLAEFGCGRFKIGRRGNPSRLVWKLSMITVGQIAAGFSEEVVEVTGPTGEPESESPVKNSKTFHTSKNLLRHSFHLRLETTVTFALPADLTPAEARRLSDYIRTLPIGDVQASEPSTASRQISESDAEDTILEASATPVLTTSKPRSS